MLALATKLLLALAINVPKIHHKCHLNGYFWLRLHAFHGGGGEALPVPSAV